MQTINKNIYKYWHLIICILKLLSQKYYDTLINTCQLMELCFNIFFINKNNSSLFLEKSYLLLIMYKILHKSIILYNIFIQYNIKRSSYVSFSNISALEL